MRWLTFVIFWLAVGFTVLTAPVAAIPVRSAHTEAELISEVSSVQPGRPFWVALRLKMDPEWHTYWLNPGDSGTATTLQWQQPAGVQASPIRWPYPQRISAPPLASYGYEGTVYLLSEIQAPADLKPGQKLALRAKAEWLECKVECLPGAGTVALELPVQAEAAVPSAHADAIASARGRLPVTVADWKLRAAVQQGQLILRATRPEWFAGEIGPVIFFPEQDLLIEPAAPQVLEARPDGFLLKLKRSAVGAAIPERIAGVLVAPAGWRGAGSEQALSARVALEPAAAVLSAGAPDLAGLLVAVAFAFLGGIILNLMPCVLPVLSIKVLGFVQEARTGHSWRYGLAFTAGVLASFWLLAGGLLLLRAGGEQLGWGFQLQSPPFLVILCAVLFLFGLNLFGIFEVGTALTRLGGAGPTGGLGGSFFSGVLATTVATPCTAPFMGSALGYALTQPTWAALLVFTALGLGMASPYLLLSLSPALLRFVPKPGAWMETFKQAMGFLLMGTVVWLGWVLGLQAGVGALAALLAALVVLGAAAWALGKWGHMAAPAPTRLTARVLAALGIVGALGMALVGVEQQSAASSGPTQATATPSEGIRWEAFSPQRLAALRAAGTPVFIDFTAAWCLSCQVNERVAFSSPQVREAFARGGFVMIKADWTKRDATIAQALAQFGRSGVPLYVLYGPTAGAPPRILPEVLTPDIIVKALQELS
ncbi:thioredoxin family protein [Gloeobacter morelensis MG652769]|uniref:Thioredoxin family protein n=1 Tax=Gloeobacter morelensis MG652769 TaxID=2781736 RepID=A0ABY3PP62_9CYAN|nr:thioredoxin family protein [Gloeobacter morelensis MG652769]